MRLFALHDSDLELKKKGSFEVTLNKARELNKQGYGIHYLPNEFKGNRKACNLSKIRYFFADIDDNSKSEQMALIISLPIKPTIIVETKNGYHCYWKAKGDVDPDNFRVIQTGLIEKLLADPACKDVCRTLRCPNFYHMKDPSDPFMVKTIHKDDREFTEKQMLLAYKPKPPKKPKYDRTNFESNKDDFFDENKFELLYKVSSIGEGGRNNDLSRIRLWLKDEGFSTGDIYNIISRINDKISNPLDDREIKMICRY